MPEQRVHTGEVDVVSDGHQRARRHIEAQAAGSVGQHQRLAAQRRHGLDRKQHAVGLTELVIVCAPAQHGDGQRVDPAEAQRSGVAAYRGLRKARQLGHRETARSRLDLVGKAAEAGPHTTATFGVKPGARARMTSTAVMRRAGGRTTSAAASRSVSTVRCTPSGPQRWIFMSSAPNSRSRWRQPPHGVMTSGPGPITAHSSTCAPAATSAAIAAASAQSPAGKPRSRHCSRRGCRPPRRAPRRRHGTPSRAHRRGHHGARQTQQVVHLNAPSHRAGRWPWAGSARPMKPASRNTVRDRAGPG